MTIDFSSHVTYRRGTKLPATPAGVRLVFVYNGKLYGLRPKQLTVSPCLYCGRPNPTYSDGRLSGFRKVGFNKHVFACYEAALAKHNLAEGNYDEGAMAHRIHPLITRRP